MGKSRNLPPTPDSRPDSPFAVLAGVSVAPGPEVFPAEPSAAPGENSGVGAPASPRSRVPGAPRALGRVVLRRETKHRGGKTVIVVSQLGSLPGFTRPDAEALVAQLKRRLGCGGTVEARDDDLELVLQGDRAAAVAALLRELGFRVDG